MLFTYNSKGSFPGRGPLKNGAMALPAPMNGNPVSCPPSVIVFGTAGFPPMGGELPITLTGEKTSLGSVSSTAKNGS